MAGGMLRTFAQRTQQFIQNATGVSGDITESTCWVHLYNTTLNDAATPATTGRVGTTAAGDNYTPTNIAMSTATWTLANSATTSLMENKIEISFTTSASTGWGTVQSFLISSSSGTGGVGMFWGDISPTQVVASGNTVKFSTGALDLKLLT